MVENKDKMEQEEEGDAVDDIVGVEADKHRIAADRIV